MHISLTSFAKWNWSLMKMKEWDLLDISLTCTVHPSVVIVDVLMICLSLFQGDSREYLFLGEFKSFKRKSYTTLHISVAKIERQRN